MFSGYSSRLTHFPSKKNGVKDNQPNRDPGLNPQSWLPTNDYFP
jgi:hypothetical protein